MTHELKSVPTKNPEPNLAELRQSAASVKKCADTLEADIKKLSVERTAALKEFRGLIGKIETRVASGEV